MNMKHGFQQLKSKSSTTVPCLHLHINHCCKCRNFLKRYLPSHIVPMEAFIGFLLLVSFTTLLARELIAILWRGTNEHKAGNQGTRELPDRGPIHQRIVCQGHCVRHDAWQMLPWKPSMQTRCRAEFAQAIFPLQDLFGLIHGLWPFLTAWPFPLARVSFHSTGRGIFDACIDGSNHFQSDGRERKGLQMTNRTFWFCYPQQCPQPWWLHCLKRSEPPAAASNPIFWDAIWNPWFVVFGLFNS